MRDKIYLGLIIGLSFIFCSFYEVETMLKVKDCENRADRAFQRSVKDFESNYNVKVLQYFNTLDVVEGKGAGWAINFMSMNTYDIDQAREHVIPLIYKIWDIMNRNSCFQDYLIRMAELSPVISKEQLSSKNIGFKISYWDENMDRPSHPHVAQVIVKSQKIFYYYAAPETQELLEPMVETFQEAKEKIELEK